MLIGWSQSATKFVTIKRTRLTTWQKFILSLLLPRAGLLSIVAVAGTWYQPGEFGDRLRAGETIGKISE
jgi:hypothetical protein